MEIQNKLEIEKIEYDYPFEIIVTNTDSLKFAKFQSKTLNKRYVRQTKINEYEERKKMTNEYTEDIKKFEVVKDAQIEIVKITLKADKTKKYLMQVVFHTSTDSKITYKPTEWKEETTLINGFETSARQAISPLLTQIPNKLRLINKALNETGSVTLFTSYTKMITSNEDGEVVYKFLSNKDFEELSAIDGKKKEIKF